MFFVHSTSTVFLPATVNGGELAVIGTYSKNATVSSTVFAMYDKWGGAATQT